MGFWAVLVPGERYRAERMFHHETLDAPEPLVRPMAAGDEVLLIADVEPRLVFGAATVRETAQGAVVLSYTRRVFDEPVPANGLALDGPATALGEEAFRAVAARLPLPPDQRGWLVSVDLPIEAGSAAEAVRTFWSYVSELGPRELPAFVTPAEDELAMEAYVLGEPASLDPEDDED